jgi:AcrR family transcriptional regulator
VASASLLARQRAEAERENHILEATLELVLESGYEGMSLDELARRAHVSKATLYSRWSGKPALIVDALGYDAASREDDDLDRGSLRADLLALGAELMSGGERSGRLVLALASAVQAEPSIAAAVSTHLAAPFETRTAAIVERAVARGELAPDALEVPYAQNLLPALTTTHLLLAPNTPIDLELFVDRILLPVLSQPTSNAKAHR